METNIEPAAASAPTPTSPKEKKYYIDTTFITPPREGVDMVSPLKDGLGEYHLKGGHKGVGGRKEREIDEIFSFSKWLGLVPEATGSPIQSTCEDDTWPPPYSYVWTTCKPITALCFMFYLDQSLSLFASVEFKAKEEEVDRADVWDVQRPSFLPLQDSCAISVSVWE